MKREWLITIGVAIFFGVVFFASRGGPDFEDVTVDSVQPELNVLAERTTIPISSTSTEELASLVGLILIVDKAEDGRFVVRRDAVVPDFRPNRDQLGIDLLGRTLYSGMVSNKFNVGGNYTDFTTSIGSDEIAEVVITDDVRIGFREPADIPWQALREFQKVPGKTYLFVESVTLTSLVKKSYKKIEGGATMSAPAFSANGSIYVSSEEYSYDAILAATPVNLSLLEPVEAGSPEVRITIQELLSEVRSGNDEKASALLTTVLKESVSMPSTVLTGAEVTLDW